MVVVVVVTAVAAVVLGAGYTEDFTPLHYFMNLFEGLRKITKILQLKIKFFEHKIIIVSSHHIWSAHPTPSFEPFSGKCHRFLQLE